MFSWSLGDLGLTGETGCSEGYRTGKWNIPREMCKHLELPHLSEQFKPTKELHENTCHKGIKQGMNE